MNHENFIYVISPMGVPTRSAMNHENCCLEEAEKAESFGLDLENLELYGMYPKTLKATNLQESGRARHVGQPWLLVLWWFRYV